MTRLSVNINKIATLRNARGGELPVLTRVATDCEAFGAQGITVHPRPDERHITRQDVFDLLPLIRTELNIEGYPDQRWMDLVKQAKPVQATLVPDDPRQLTSDHGWDTIKHAGLLNDIIAELKAAGCRVSLFIDPIEQFIEGAAQAGADRVEFYTGPYAKRFPENKEKAIAPYVKTAAFARQIGLGINAGHDLNLENLPYLRQQIPYIDEVSIGHALICDALYYGLENTIQLYLKALK